MADDGRVARAFHDRTAHSPESVRTSGHTLAWDVKPLPFKIYADLAPLALPRDILSVETDALVALTGSAPPPAARLDLATLAALLYYTAGVTRRKTYRGGADVYFRAAPSTGALFQTEVYVAVGDVDGVSPGLYHFGPGDFALRRIREGDVRGALAAAAADEALARRAAIVILTAIPWRNTWKYRARGYRHLFWDSGTMLANLAAVGTALGLRPRIVTAFVDADVDRLLGLDGTHEVALELVPLGPDAAAPDPSLAAGAALPALAHRVVPLSSTEVDEPRLREVHVASGLASPAEVSTWRARPPLAAREPRGELTPLPPPRARGGRGLGDTIRRRGSTREFAHAPLDALELGTALASATAPVAGDVPGDLVEVYLVVNAVEGLGPGAYAYRPGGHGLEPIRAGEFRGRSAWLCLEQALGGDAAAVLFFLSPLDAVLARFGSRGYRCVNLAAGLAGGRAYLAAYAQGFGATGLTFYDRHVVEFFAPHASGLDAIFVTALGRAARDAPERGTVLSGAAVTPPIRSPRRPSG